MPRGGFGGFRGGFGMRGGMGMMRRGGFPIIGPGPVMDGFGGGMGMGMGSPLLTALLSGGLGYVVGSGSGQRQMSAQQNARIGQLEQQQYQQQQPPAASYPPYPYPSYPPTQPAPVPQAPVATTESDMLAQLRLLGQLHQSGVLTDDEFEAEKQKILRR
ncbi:MAG: SHOCT domain-containing protein [Ktedonobacterales bacterium]